MCLIQNNIKKMNSKWFQSYQYIDKISGEHDTLETLLISSFAIRIFDSVYKQISIYYADRN